MISTSHVTLGRNIVVSSGNPVIWNGRMNVPVRCILPYALNKQSSHSDRCGFASAAPMCEMFQALMERGMIFSYMVLEEIFLFGSPLITLVVFLA